MRAEIRASPNCRQQETRKRNGKCQIYIRRQTRMGRNILGTFFLPFSSLCQGLIKSSWRPTGQRSLETILGHSYPDWRAENAPEKAPKGPKVQGPCTPLRRDAIGESGLASFSSYALLPVTKSAPVYSVMCIFCFHCSLICIYLFLCSSPP